MVRQGFKPIQFLFDALSFFHDFEAVESFSISKPNVQLNRLLAYLGKKTVSIKSNPDQEYNLLLKVETRFVKSTTEDTLLVKAVKSRKDADNPELVREVILTEEDITEKYPWAYNELCKRLKNRYSDFKQDAKFNRLNKQLKSSKNLCHERVLHPNNPNSIRTYLYNPNCIPAYFDHHYKIK